VRETPLHVRSIRTIRRNNPFRVLAEHRNFRIFWIGQTLSLMGTWIQVMGEGWLALELTNNAFLVTLVSAVGALPVLALSMQAGVIVDRLDKLKIVRTMQALMLIEAVTLWVVTLTGHVNIYWLLGLAALSGIFSSFEIPARQAMMIELVGREDLAGAIALNSSGFNLARIVGPAIGAIVIATAGIAWCFALNAVSYLSVLIGLYLIHLPKHVERMRRTDGSEMREGIRYMLSTPEVRILMVLVTVVSVFGSPYIALMPVIARDRLGSGAGGYGSLLTAIGIGGLFGALFLASVGARIKRGRLLAWSTTVFAAALLALALTRVFHLAWWILLVAGCSMILNGALSNALLQTLVPDELRGRLMAAYSLVVVGLSQVAGNFVAGAVARIDGPQFAVAGGSAIIFVVVVWAFTTHRELLQL
jgi:MFS family permease